ncbi:MAG: hypothetical protein K2X53_04990, partial [Alphaproteobacteria bacterium]|nr:hypothetical protein [Alphaproteobacteria bacterium]
DVLKKYRLGILAGEAFYNAYYDQVKNLSPTIENSKNSFSYVAQTTAWKDFYRQKIIDHFGPDTQRVLDYLFAPAQAEPPFDKINSMSDGVRAIETELRESIPNTKKLLDIISGKSGGILRRGPSQKELQVMLRAFKIIASDQGLDVEGFFKAQKFLKVSMTQKTHQIICCGILLLLRSNSVDGGIQDKIKNIFSKEVKHDLWAKIKGIASR